jgi:NTE family protein
MRRLQRFGSKAAFLLTITFFAPAPPTKAQDKPNSHSHRQTVGLVLSGGGARGTAHVGVLKALEELQIPIDCISGTSMGAVVGGLYASGLSPAELDDWLRHADWHFLLSDSLPRESEAFRTKQRQFDMNQGIAFNVSRNAKLKLPAGLITGRNIMASLRQLTVPVRNVRDFDRLPIRFRALATDLETGERVVLRDGDLVESIRASMSIPAIFTAQPIHNRMLVDGGLSSNLPVEVTRDMGPDVIIAIDASEQLKKASELDTAPKIANQVLTIFTQNQMRDEIARLGPGDTLVRIKIEDMAPTDFVEAAKGIDAGYQQTMQRSRELARYSVGREQFDAYLLRQRIARAQPVQVSFFEVQTPEGQFEHALKHPLEFNVKDHRRFARLQSFLGDLGEMQKFDIGDYEVIERDGRYGLLIKARKRKSGPTYLNFGFDFAYSSADDADFTLLLSYRMTELNSLGAEWSTYLGIGDTTRIITEWYQPVDRERRFFFAAQGLFGSDFIEGRDVEGDPLRFRLQDHAVGLDLGARLWQAGEFRVGYARGFSRISRRLGVPEEVPPSVDRGWMHADLTLDTLDAPGFATRGSYGRISVIASREELGASDNYTRFQGQYYQPITFGKNTFVPRLSAALKVGDGDVPLYDQVPLGGFLNLSGLPRGTLFGENSALAELVYYRKVADVNPGIGRAIYAGASIEAGEIWGDTRGFHLNDIVMAGSVFLGADTFIGPLYLGIGLAEGGDAAIYLQLGPPFRQGRHQR